MRHSAAHVMAEVVQAMFPGAKFGIGPTIDDGFYYDFELPRPLVPDDLPAIEAKMRDIITANHIFQREDVEKEKARQLFASQPYKLELIDELPDGKVTVYRQGSFTDLCRGPHVDSTGNIGPFKLTSIAGAYWRGDEHRTMLQRIYGTAFATKEALDDYLHKIEEAARRDHRKLGRELDLYSIQEEVGPGLALWHPKGAMVRHIVEGFWKREHIKRGYQLVYSPHIARLDLWKTSGHWELYRESLYSPMDIEGQDYIVKPMNCPFHIFMYKSRMRSYRELPLRLAELGTVYRYERSGTLHGLARVRGFTQDDAHIFCRPDQLQEEIINVLELSRFMMKSFGFQDYEVLLSTRPDKYSGTLEIWAEATQALEKALAQSGIPYKVDPGEGVFYGPKVDIKLKDALGRLWQGPTTQVDFNLPQRFDVNYIGDDSKEHQVVMVHRTVLGSMERFMATLVEHYGGAFPVWLAPVQATVIPIADRHLDYANQLANRLRAEEFRVEVDARTERMNLKIREAQLNKVPYMLVVGDKEQATGTASVRQRNNQDLGQKSVDDFIALARAAIDNKT
ncbi:MAG: threonine--tRNA ligase [Dehalococcoidia bacterium]|nr:threonine--tRNA ligase [Dehalococcoidia bacterium]